ncbi:MAG: DUF87 domain-containing protein [Magnetococcales bacterium]|nr:DUF87 domain-containing protein [Magnetococcales bacterium]
MIDKNAFLNALEQAYEDTVGEKRHANELAIGTFTMEENPALATFLIDQVVTRKGKLDTRQQFLKRFQVPLKKPTPPARSPEHQHLYSKKSLRGQDRFNFEEMEIGYQIALQAFEKKQDDFERRAVTHEAITHHYAQDQEGYLQYIRNAMGESQTAFFGRTRTLYLPEKHRARNAYVVGRVGVGKSETLKTLMHHNIKNNSAAVVMLDPHSDLALEVGHLKELRENGRLVYIDPGLSPHHTPAMNPFEIEDRTPAGINYATKQLYNVFKELLLDSSGIFTNQMETLLKRCVKTLLTRGDVSILDLLRFMDDNQNGEYVKFALENLETENEREYFTRDFKQTRLTQTKDGIRSKLNSLITDRTFGLFLTKPATFDLQAEMEKKSVIVFNLADDESGILGKFILARIKNIALSRKRTPKSKRVPAFVYVDEAHLFLTPAVTETLRQARKFCVSIFAASQAYGQDMNGALREAITVNTNIKMTSRNSDKSNTAFAADTKTPKKELETLAGGEFMVKIDPVSPKEIEIPGIRVHPPETLLGFKHAMSREEWNQEIKRQLELYYVPLAKASLPEPSKPSDKRRTAGKIDL